MMDSQTLSSINGSSVNSSGIIWWPKLCGNETLYDAFWVSSLSIYTDHPDVTDCFSYTALAWTPALYLLMTSLFLIPYLRSLPNVNERWQTSVLDSLKMLLLLALTIETVATCVIVLAVTEAPLLTYLPPAILDSLTMLTVLFYTHWIFRKGLHTSATLLGFWVTQLICDSIRLVSFLHRQESGIGNWRDFVYGLFYAKYVMVLMGFVLSIPSDTSAIPAYQSKTKASEKDYLLNEDTYDKEPLANPCPFNVACVMSRLTFSWMNRFMYEGYKRIITFADIWDIRKEDSCDTVVNTFLEKWEDQLTKAGYERRLDGSFLYDTATKKSPSLTCALIKSFPYVISVGGLMLLFGNLFSLLNPIILDMLLDFVTADDPYMWHGYFFAIAMVVSMLISLIMMQNSFFINSVGGMHIRSALTGAIYRKAMRLSPSSTVTRGEITTMISVDTQKLQEILMVAHYLWVSPVMIAVGIYCLWQRLGVASMVGLLWYSLCLPAISVVCGTLIRKYQQRNMVIKDTRIKLTNQVISGIKVLKLYGWEPQFEERICEIREAEVDELTRQAKMTALSFCITFNAGCLTSLLTFVMYIFTIGDGILTPDVAFVCISLMNTLGLPMMILPQALVGVAQAMVSMNRIGKFLLEPELSYDDIIRKKYEGAVVAVKNGLFSWGDAITLKDVDFKVESGTLVAVVGQVGSGKSSLISAILGDMRRLKGRVYVSGSTAYVPQEAWIQNMSLKNNILFEQPFNKQKYQRIISNCCLTDDLKVLAGGDSIEIGEKGINLSGGQKQRVALARACYQESDIYLLDDPLSAVDAHVGKDIFDNVIGPKGMLKGKTRILTTNSVAFLDQADLIIVLEDGRISECGPYTELLSNRGAFANYISSYSHTVEAEEETEFEEATPDTGIRQWFNWLRTLGTFRLTDLPFAGQNGHGNGSGVVSPTVSPPMSPPVRRRKLPSSQRSVSSGSESEARRTRIQDVAIAPSSSLTSEEAVESGNIKMSTLTTYMKSASCRWLTIMVIGVIANIFGIVAMNIWLSIWSNDSLVSDEYAVDKMPLRVVVYMLYGTILSAGSVLIIVSITMGSVTSSRVLHNQLLGNILKLPMSFFETTPQGRIINRFSKDMDTLDDTLRLNLILFMCQLASVVPTVVIILYTSPIFILVLIPMFIGMAILQRMYVSTARQVKRIDSVKRSPIFNHFTESLNGISSIRAYNQEERFIRNSDTLLDDNQKCWFTVITSQRWMGMTAASLSTIVSLFVCIFCVARRDILDPGTVGLAITYSLAIRGIMVNLLRVSCDLETFIVSVERIVEYTEIPNEAPWHVPALEPPPTWPSQGQITFHRLCLRYRPGLDLVLKGINFTIYPGEKVGIVGKTGAGKSSITVALFRMVEAASGAIVVDGQTLSHLGLHDVRRNLTIMPQDPVVFSGSLRFNVDPSMEHTDRALWEALELAHLKDFVIATGEGLDFECGENGGNMSVGQRQLLCLSRALLRKPKVLVLDEATAAIDLETDDLIQETIRTGFQNCTILSIAHRLNTIMDYDRVMVMAAGRVAEFDTPSNLIGDEDSIFHSMAKDAGLL